MTPSLELLYATGGDLKKAKKKKKPKKKKKNQRGRGKTIGGKQTQSPRSLDDLIEKAELEKKKEISSEFTSFGKD